MRALIAVAGFAISLALALLGWGLELKFGITTLGAYVAGELFPYGKHNSIFGYIVLRLAVDWIFWFALMCGLYWLFRRLWQPSS